MENKTSEELKSYISNKLESVGLLAVEDQSIFSTEPLIEVRGDGLMMIGPHHDIWAWVNVIMTEEQLDDEVKKFTDIVIPNCIRIIDEGKIEMNTNISVSTYIKNLAKVLNGTEPSDDYATTPLAELVKKIIPVNPTKKEEK